jgi:hypothetical protein
MTDRHRAQLGVVAVRIGRTDLGHGAVTIDDDALTIAVRDDSSEHAAERPIRIRLAAIDSVLLAEGEIAVAVRDGTRLALGTPGAVEMCASILAHCRALPELTHALRAFGSRRGSRSRRASGPSEQQRFFAPLLDARRRAVVATTPTETIDAFDAGPLARSMEGAVHAFAVERSGPDGPEKRALEAELVDSSEPLHLTLERLGVAAEAAKASLDDLGAWRLWATELRTTFEVADRVWLVLDTALDAALPPSPKR